VISLNYLPKFEEDVLDIWSYIAQNDPRTADRFVEKIYERCLILRAHPKAGPSRPDIAADCRHLVVGPVLILYRHRPDAVDLVRALHGKREIEDEMFSAALPKS
jgi:toxin ParE1/3/4